MKAFKQKEKKIANNHSYLCTTPNGFSTTTQVSTLVAFSIYKQLTNGKKKWDGVEKEMWGSRGEDVYCLKLKFVLVALKS